MKKRVILVGCAASGKDYARKVLQEAGFTYQVSYTTRPPRKGEVDGVDYNFKTVADFESMIKFGEFYEHVSFNNWHYGSTKVQMQNSGSVFIMTPSGINHLEQKDRDESLVIYFNIDELVRRVRLSSRKDASDTIERRILADRKDFRGFANYDLQVQNEKFLGEILVQEVNKFVAK